MIRFSLFILWSIAQIHLAYSSGYVQVELQSIRDLGKETLRQACCDSSNSCSFPCDLLVRTCLSNQSIKKTRLKAISGDASFDCPKYFTDIKATVSFQNQTSFLPVKRSLTLPFPSLWAGLTSLRIQLLKSSDHSLLDRFSVDFTQKTAYGSGEIFEGHQLTATSVSSKTPTIIDLRLASVCDKKSRAPNCIERCEPKDDCSGHYECDPVSGIKVCLPGWTGANCNKQNGDLQTCDSDCCCSSGWTGLDCSEAVVVVEPAKKSRVVRQVIGDGGLGTRVGLLPVAAPRQEASNNADKGIFHAGRRPAYNANAQSDPQVFQTLDYLSSIERLDSTYGVHRVALLNSPQSIQQLESALQGAWYHSNLASSGIGQQSVVVRILSFREYGVFSDAGLPVIDVIYAVGINRSSLSNPTQDLTNVRIPNPENPALAAELSKQNLQLCDCDVYEGQLLHLQGIFNFVPLLPRIRDSLRTAWISSTPSLGQPGANVEVQFARTVITIGTSGVRLTTVPYILMLNGRVWSPSPVTGDIVRVPDAGAVQNTLNMLGAGVQVYQGRDTPLYAALAFVNFLNASIHYQDMQAVQRSLQSYVARSIPQPQIKVENWNMEPYLDTQANIITQSSFFLTLPNSITLDPRLYYAPPVIATLARHVEGNVSVVTGETLGIHPLYLVTQIGGDKLRAIAEIIKLTFAESNPTLNADDVQVAIVSLDDGVAPVATRGKRQVPQSEVVRSTPVTELHVSAMVNGIDPDRTPGLTRFNTLLNDPRFQDSLDSRLGAFGTSVCRDCAFRKLRSVNLLQVDPTTTPVPDARTILEKTLAAWTEANPQSPWLPLDVQLVARDDALANENGTLVTRLAYSVGYATPNLNWYIPRDPTNDALDRKMNESRATAYFGEVIAPQQITLTRQLNAEQDQARFSTAAIQAWAQDKPELAKCAQPDANCFVALVEADSPVVSTSNGAPRFQYKYFILVDDKVYTPSSSLSNGQLVRLRDALEGTDAVPVVIPVAPTQAAIPVAVTEPTTLAAAVTVLAPIPVVVGPSSTGAGSQVIVRDQLNMITNTARGRTNLLEIVRQVWASVLAPTVSNVAVTYTSDRPAFPNPQMPDGRNVRFIQYDVTGEANGNVDIPDAVRRFRIALANLNHAQINPVNPEIAALTSAPTAIPPFVVDFGRVPVDGGVTAATTLAPTTQTALVTFADTTITTVASAVPVVVPVVVPVIVPAQPAGTFNISGNRVALLADTRRLRDRALNEQLKPIWETALGPGVSNVQLNFTSDVPNVPNQTPNGQSIRLITYSVVGNSATPIDTEAARLRFLTEAQSAEAPSVWALLPPTGEPIVLGGSTRIPPQTTTTAATTTTSSIQQTSTQTASATVIAVVQDTTTQTDQSNTTASQAALAPVLLLSPVIESEPSSKFSTDLVLKSFAPTDEPAIEQTLQAIWAQALELTPSDIKISKQPTSGPLPPATDGSSMYHYRYDVLLNRNITDPASAWARYLMMLSRSDLQEMLHETPTTTLSPTTTTTIAAPVEIPILSFNEVLDVASSDPGQIWPIVDGLKGLWAEAGNVPPANAEVRLLNLSSYEPARFTPNGTEIKALSYSVTLQNVTDLPVVRTRAQTLLPASPLRAFLPFATEVATTVATTLESTTSGAAVLVPVVIPVLIETTTSAPVVATTVPPMLSPVLPSGTHQMDIYSANVDMNQVTRFLQMLWAQSYQVPVQRTNVTILNTQPMPVDPSSADQRPITRLTYNVQVPNRSEDPQALDNFNSLLKNSPLAQFIVQGQPERVVLAPTQQVAQNLTVAVATPADFDVLTNGIRTSWTSALGLEGDPQSVKIILSGVQPENFANAAGVPVSSVNYRLEVPATVKIGEEEHVKFRTALAQSPAAALLYTAPEITTVATTLESTTEAPSMATYRDAIVLSGTSKLANNRILNEVGKKWGEALAPEIKDVTISLESDVGNVPPTTAEGTPLRLITYNINGTAVGVPPRDYDAKMRFRQLMRSAPLTGVASVPELPVITTVASIMEETSTTATVGVVVPIVITLPQETTTTTETTTTETTTTTTTTLVPNISAVKYLQLRRPVAYSDRSAVAQLIGEAWAEQNGVPANAVNVEILSTDEVVDDGGNLASNVTYRITAQPNAIANEPTAETENKVLSQKGWPVCANCLVARTHRFYVTLDENEDHLDPVRTREQILAAVHAANPNVDPNDIQVSFPQGHPPQEANVVLNDGRSLALVHFFAVQQNKNGNVANLMEAPAPTVDQLQAQFVPRTVVPENSSSVVEPVRLLLQRDGTWTDGSYISPLDATSRNVIQDAVSAAVQSSASKSALPCQNCAARPIKERNLLGRFGRPYTQLTFLPENVGQVTPNLTQSIAAEAQAAIDRNLTAVRPVALSSAASTGTDPNQVYIYDFSGRRDIFYVQRNKELLTRGWLAANPICTTVNCSATPVLLATQRRMGNDGEELSRVFYTVRSPNPYVSYPPPSVLNPTQTVPSKAIQQASLIPSLQRTSDVQAALQEAILESSRRQKRQAAEQPAQAPTEQPMIMVPVEVQTQTPSEMLFTLPLQTEAPTVPTTVVPQLISVRDTDRKFCFHKDNNSFTEYRVAEYVVNDEVNNAAAAGVRGPVVVVNDCKNCICDIPGYVALLKGHVNASQMSILGVEEAVKKAWLAKYGQVTEEMTGIKPSEWQTYMIDRSDYRFRNSENQNEHLTLATYGILVANAPPKQLLMDALPPADLQSTWSDQESLPKLCVAPDCLPQVNSFLYASGLPRDSEGLGKVSEALRTEWQKTNPEIGMRLRNLTVSDGYSRPDVNGTYSIPVQRLDYQVLPLTYAATEDLADLSEPRYSDIDNALRQLNTSYSAFDPSLIKQKTATGDLHGEQVLPYWLPAAIIIPLAGLIAFTILLVCLVTRASRIFRSKKMVIITDPSTIPKTLGEAGYKSGQDVTSFKEGNGKSNMGFDDYHNGRQDISKV